MALTVYTLSTCDTCRRATRWLREHSIPFDEKPIRETPPSAEELGRMLAAKGGVIRSLFNTSGREYRAQHLGDRLPAMDAETAIRTLADNGSLVKRPFAIGDGVALVGFDEAAWRAAFRRENL